MINKIKEVYIRINTEFLSMCPFGPMNTKNFREKFKQRLESEIENSIVKCDEENNTPDVIDSCCIVAKVSWIEGNIEKYCNLVFGQLEKTLELQDIPFQGQKPITPKDSSILTGVFTTFGNDESTPKKLGKKIKNRKCIPNYHDLDMRVRRNIPENFNENDYNFEYIKLLEDYLYTCKEFECGNISDSSSILILSVEDNFDEYTLRGLFDKKIGSKLI